MCALQPGCRITGLRKSTFTGIQDFANGAPEVAVADALNGWGCTRWWGNDIVVSHRIEEVLTQESGPIIDAGNYEGG